VAPGTRVGAWTALVKKCASDLALVMIRRVEGDGSHPAGLLTFTHEKLESASPEGVPSGVETVISHLDRLNSLSRRLNGMYWKGHMLSSSTMMFGDSP